MEVVVTAHPDPATGSRAPVSVTEVDGCAVLRFAGELTADRVLDLEQQLLDVRPSQVREWVLDMSDLTSMDLTCAYALLRAATRVPATTTVRVRGARRTVQRTLQHAGVDTLAAIE
ncbi:MULTISPECIES: STAS domain-containing protein [unclassified Streptomyces]|uniref:STAS domain-containing protein n=1 Tax=unclassified Streptomyces TaxID=2593676 RepID=UPI00068DA2E1|nr:MULTISPECIES: STAS domain-containing protein [unclassified Streptomyces]